MTEQTEDQSETFGEWLYRQRTLRKLTQAKLAARLKPFGVEVTNKWISGLEVGRKHHITGAVAAPSPPLLRALARVFELPEVDVFSAAGMLDAANAAPPPEPRPAIMLLADRYGALTDPRKIELADRLIAAIAREIEAMEIEEK